MFCKVASINCWEADIANHLFAHLRGPALEVACALPDEDSENYDCLVATLEAQFGPAKQPELYLFELSDIVKKSNESYRELGRRVMTLCKWAYPTLTFVERERAGRMHFIDAVTEAELCLFILQRKPVSLNEAVQLADEFSGYRKIQTQHRNRSQSRFTSNVTEEEHSGLPSRLDATVNTLAQLVPAHSINHGRNRRRRPACWVCDKVGHISRFCPGRYVNV